MFYSAFLADLAWVSGYLLWQIRRVIQRKPKQDPPRLLRDFLNRSVLAFWTLPSIGFEKKLETVEKAT